MTTPRRAEPEGSNVVGTLMLLIVVLVGFLAWREWTGRKHALAALASSPAPQVVPHSSRVMTPAPEPATPDPKQSASLVQ